MSVKRAAIEVLNLLHTLNIFNMTSSQLTAKWKSAFCGVLILLTGCKSLDVAPRYTAHYIKSNEGKVTTHVPEAYELGYVVLALTDVARRDSSLINTNSAYYKELTSYFDKHKTHHAVAQLNRDLTAFPKLLKSYRNGLFAFKMHNGRFALDENYRIDMNKAEFSRYALLLQEFYHASNFGKFYTEHKDVYDRMIAEASGMTTYASLQQQLDKDKDAKSYKILLSPLMKGMPDMMLIKDDAFSECVLFPYMAPHGMVYGDDKNEVITKS